MVTLWIYCSFLKEVSKGMEDCLHHSLLGPLRGLSSVKYVSFFHQLF